MSQERPSKTFFEVTLKKRYLLNSRSSSKRTYHIELELKDPSFTFEPGDSIGLIPENSASIVERILQRLSLKRDEPIFDKRQKKELPAEVFFRSCANINKITSSLYNYIAEGKEAGLSSDELKDYELWDLLEEFDHTLCPHKISSCLLPQMPRFYSIASSLKVHPKEVHLTVAELTYETRGITRTGVGSNYLIHTLSVGSPLSIYHHPSRHFKLPEDHKAPIIMIGPGTGIAPFRAFMQERESIRDAKQWLFFGERNENDDFYYQDYLKKLEGEDRLKLTTAFSRDQEKKVYVQDRMLEHKKELYNWIKKGAIIYVCGDAKQMAKGVEEALLSIISDEGNLSKEEAQSYLKSMRREKRYLLDVY